jgi:hypothetical protein
VTGLRVWHSLKIHQSIDVLDLTWIAHAPPVRTLRQFMTQVGHGYVRTILLKQAVNPILPSSAALVADQAHHPLFGRSLTERIGTVGHRHNQLSRLSARSICAVTIDPYLWHEISRNEQPVGPDDAAAFAYVWYRRRTGAPKAAGQIANT